VHYVFSPILCGCNIVLPLAPPTAGEVLFSVAFSKNKPTLTSSSFVKHGTKLSRVRSYCRTRDYAFNVIWLRRHGRRRCHGYMTDSALVAQSEYSAMSYNSQPRPIRPCFGHNLRCNRPINIAKMSANEMHVVIN